MSEPRLGSCHQCEFFRRTNPPGDLVGEHGQCRRHAPTYLPCVELTDVGFIPARADWPRVTKYDGCGDFKFSST